MCSIKRHGVARSINKADVFNPQAAPLARSALVDCLTTMLNNCKLCDSTGHKLVQDDAMKMSHQHGTDPAEERTVGGVSPHARCR